MASTSITFRNSSDAEVVVQKSTEQREYAFLQVGEQCGQVTSVGEKWVIRATGGPHNGKVMARTEGSLDASTCVIGKVPLGEDVPAPVAVKEEAPAATSITFVNKSDTAVTAFSVNGSTEVR